MVSTQLILKLNLSNTLVIASTDTHSTGTAQIHRMLRFIISIHIFKLGNGKFCWEKK